MTLFDRLARIRAYEPKFEDDGRVRAETLFAAYLSKSRDGLYDDLIDAAAKIFCDSLDEHGALTSEAAERAEELLLPLSDEAKNIKIHLVAHAHIDMNWMWGYEETASVTVNTFRTMLDLMDRYPDFTFSQSQASTFEIIEKYAPELLEEIKERVAEGRFEVSSATWVEEDENMPCAESFARHMLYTRRYYRALFGEEFASPELDFQPDTFGHSAVIPEICEKASVRYFYHCRGSEDVNGAYIWRGESGAELLCYRDPAWYSMDTGPELFNRYPEEYRKSGVPCFLVVYGVGDHGGGPSARDIENLLKMREYPVMPTLIFSTYRAFFGELEKYRDLLPVHTGEINFVFSGCYTTQSETKARNRAGELRLYEAEALTAFATEWSDLSPHCGIYESAWRKLLFCQFHDILPGSGVRATTEYASGCLQEALAAAVSGANCAMRSIAEQIDLSHQLDQSAPAGAGAGFGISAEHRFSLSVPSGNSGKRRAFHLFNVTAAEYEGVCRLTVWDWDHDGGRAFFTDPYGQELESVFLFGSRGYWGHEYKEFLVYAEIPALGYTTVFLDEREREYLEPVGGFGNRETGEFPQTIVLENGLVRAEFDRKTATLNSFVDLKSGKEFFCCGSGFFRAATEHPRGMTAWKEGEEINERNLNKTVTVKITGVSLNPLCSSFTYRLSFDHGSDIEATVSLDKGSTLLRVDLRVNYYEKGSAAGIPRLDFVMNLAEKAESCRYGIPFGVIDRPALRHDVPAFFAAPLCEGTAVPYLTAFGKYGFRCEGTTLSLTLLRASIDPDPMPEYGSHCIRFAVGAASDRAGAVLTEISERYFHDTVVCPAVNGKGMLPLSSCFAHLDNASLVALKNAEDFGGVVFRIASNSEREETFALTYWREIEEAFLADIHETPLCKLQTNYNTATGKILPGEFLTLIVR